MHSKYRWQSDCIFFHPALLYWDILLFHILVNIRLSCKLLPLITTYQT